MDKNCLYVVVSNLRNKYYVGSHKSTEAVRSKQYLGSGDRISLAVQEDGIDNFTSYILKELDDRLDAASAERQVLIALSAKADPKSFNLTHETSQGFNVFLKHKTKRTILTPQEVSEYVKFIRTLVKETEQETVEMPMDPVESNPKIMERTPFVILEEVVEFVNRDYEEKGCADAMIAQDKEFLDDNLYKLKLESRTKFDLFLSELNDFKRYYKNNYDTFCSIGLVEKANVVSNQIESVEEKITVVEKYKDDCLKENSEYWELINKSYVIGFKKGVIAIKK